MKVVSFETLARRRYPNEDQPNGPEGTTLNAVMMMASDRRHAGLGALRGTPLQDTHYRPVRNYKWRSYEADDIRYRMSVRRPATRKIDPDRNVLILVPAVDLQLERRFQRYDFETQTGRTFVAECLREMRIQRWRALHPDV